jgi:hypothetical protein
MTAWIVARTLGEKCNVCGRRLEVATVEACWATHGGLS